jgi:hypothetical protein
VLEQVGGQSRVISVPLVLAVLDRALVAPIGQSVELARALALPELKVFVAFPLVFLIDSAAYIAEPEGRGVPDIFFLVLALLAVLGELLVCDLPVLWRGGHDLGPPLLANLDVLMLHLYIKYIY